MLPKRIVLFQEDSSLYLRNLTWNGDQLTSGFVINGGWKLVINYNRGRFEAKDGRYVVTHRPLLAPDYVEVPAKVIDFHGDDYNEVIAWAESQPKIKLSLDDV